MANYYAPDILIGTTEISGKISVKEDYNYEVYNVTATPPIYWDSTFRSNLTDATIGSNVSYASMPIGGDRQTKHWRDTLDGTYPITGNRGVNQGNMDPAVYNQSITLQIHGGKKEWDGNIVFNDNHTIVQKGFFPEGVNYLAANNNYLPDNLFKNDGPPVRPTQLPARMPGWSLLTAPKLQALLTTPSASSPVGIDLQFPFEFFSPAPVAGVFICKPCNQSLKAIPGIR